MTTRAIAGTGDGGFVRFMFTLFLFAILAGAGWVLMTKSHAARHSNLVQDISSKCNESNYQLHFHRPSDDRHAYLCFVEGFFVFTIKNFSPERIEKYGDDVVTAFPRRNAKMLQDAIDYITCTKAGVPVPCGIDGGPYLPAP